MIDIEQTILNILREGGGNELAITEGQMGPAQTTMIRARTTAIHARYFHKAGTATTLEGALIEVAHKLGAEAPIALRDDLCPICGLPLVPAELADGHPECREQE